MSELFKVSLIVPLTFCIQTIQVKKKRRKYLLPLLVSSILYYGMWLIYSGYQLIFGKAFNYFQEVVVVVSSITLSIMLLVSLRRIRTYTKKFATPGMFPDEKLLRA